MLSDVDGPIEVLTDVLVEALVEPLVEVLGDMLTDVDGPTEVLIDALGDTLFETLGEVLGDMLTDALVDGLAEVPTDTLAETLIETGTVDCALVAPNKRKHCLVSFYLATPTQEKSVQDLNLYVKKIRKEKIMRCTAYLPEWKVLY